MSNRMIKFVCILLLVCTDITVQSQSAVDKSAKSTISGKVIVGGKGASGVVVGLVHVPERSRKFPTRFRAATDEEGNYRITNVQPGTYEVVASAPAYVVTEGSKTLIVGKNEVIENIDITLLRGGVITGKVVDADGRPVIEEWIYLSLAGPRQQIIYARSIRTDDRGIYRAFGIPAGSYKVMVGRDEHTFGTISGKAGYQRTYHPSTIDPAEATVIEVSEGSEATNVDIAIGRSINRYSARGRLIDGDTSKPMPGVRIGMQVFFQNGSASSTAAESNKDGEFNVENLAPGRYAVYVEAPAGSEWHAEPVRFEVIDQDVDGLLLKTSIGGSASGVVVLEGTDDPKVRASLAQDEVVALVMSDYIGRTTPSAKIQPNGSFRLTGLAAGRLMFQLRNNQLRIIRLERDGVSYTRGIEIKDGEQVTGLRLVVSHANGIIRGVVKVPEGLVLPADTRFVVGYRRTEDGPQNSFNSPAEVDARGQFLVDDLVPGTYEISVGVIFNIPPAQRPRIPRTTQTVVVTNSSAVDVTITLQMPRPAPSGP